MSKSNVIYVKETAITIIEINNQDYISLTDMVKSFDTGLILIEKWLRNKNTIDFLGIWEGINNPDFNSTEFGGIMMEAGLNKFGLSVKKWVNQTNAIGLIARAGRYNSGTYAHKDIAFEFGSWLSPEFKLYLIKEFQRLKDEESKKNQSKWDLQRMLSKVNYRIHTDAIRETLIPQQIGKQHWSKIYASEAELLNVAIFGMTSGEWQKRNPLSKGNLRDEATLEQLVVLSNLESVNAVFVRQQLSQQERLKRLNEIAISQMKSLLFNSNLKKLKQG
jgi:hypothetical protein